MARRLLGQPVDVHGGGTDLIFPHHESELAQAEGVPGPRPFVRHWMHTGTVYMHDEKMSKSLGNLVFVRDLLERYTARAIRRFLLRHHYREDWAFREKDLELEATGRAPAGAQSGSPFDPAAGRAGLFAALEEDLDTPKALAVLDRAAASSGTESRSLLAEGQRVLGLDL
jgi:L-cysteine:1D-myo-inositol 2-amino-2-deoxy-alpha-D-glucopyranoside ligase